MPPVPVSIPLADAQPLDNPLAFAVSERDGRILAEVQSAIAEGRVRLAWQQVVASGHNDQILFYEGLARVIDAQGRILPARDFMPSIEAHEIGRRLDCLALEMGLNALQAHPGLRISINMSARSIGYRRWLQTLDAALMRTPDLGTRLILEITESSAMVMPDTVSVFMTDLHARGITFALDDFGAGYTSFRYLTDFTFDLVKIDGQFIRGIATEPDHQVLTEALITIGQHFGMLTVAESVETLEDATFLAKSGVDFVQGHFFGVPTLTPPWARAPARLDA
jgi:EAL domain-containing protein (putative c-di-GMP-specific phosphodiesterase class I)